jgi:hypothetical protein
MPSIADYVGLGQSAAITIVFLFISWNLPGLFRAYFAWQETMRDRDHTEAERIRTWQSQERIADREARHQANALYQKALAETFQDNQVRNDKLVEALHALTMQVQTMCQWRQTAYSAPETPLFPTVPAGATPLRGGLRPHTKETP